MLITLTPKKSNNSDGFNISIGWYHPIFRKKASMEISLGNYYDDNM